MQTLFYVTMAPDYHVVASNSKTEGMRMAILFTVEEAAQILKVSEDTVRRWLRDGTLRGRKLGRVWRISEEEIRGSASSYPLPQDSTINNP